MISKEDQMYQRNTSQDYFLLYDYQFDRRSSPEDAYRCESVQIPALRVEAFEVWFTVHRLFLNFLDLRFK